MAVSSTDLWWTESNPLVDSSLPIRWRASFAVWGAVSMSGVDAGALPLDGASVRFLLSGLSGGVSLLGVAMPLEASSSRVTLGVR